MDPAVVVGLDFGTTYSGFAFAHRKDPLDVHILENWPSWEVAGGRTYCKTQTSLFYESTGLGTLELKAWGWPALLAYTEAIKGTGYASVNLEQNDLASAITTVRHNGAVFATKFKLLLAPDSTKEALPFGLSAERLVSDYLKCMSEYIVDHLKEKYGKHFVKRDVQWCITVPAIWDEGAKQKMQVCCEMAGMVEGKYCKDSSASSHSLRIVLEPEAASMYCQRQLHHISLQVGDEFMVVDIGGGTIDLVVHKKANNNLYQVHEAARNCGQMGGGTFVDSNFFRYLSQQIGCFPQFGWQDPNCFLKVLKWWSEKKCSFDGSSSSIGMAWDIPSRLSSALRKYDKLKGMVRPECEYEEFELPIQVYKDLFDTEVDKTLRLIQQQLELCPDVKCLLVVGGFSDNSYMMNRIKELFCDQVENIIVPVNPGASVLHGAVRFGFQSDLVLSRISKKTYGMQMWHKFDGYHSLDHVYTDADGVQLKEVFDTFVRKNESVLIDSCVVRTYSPVDDDQEKMDVSLFSSVAECPIYTTDPGCVEEEHKYNIDISQDLHFDKERR